MNDGRTNSLALLAVLALVIAGSAALVGASFAETGPVTGMRAPAASVRAATVARRAAIATGQMEPPSPARRDATTREARRLLARLIAEHPVLEGSTIRVGRTHGGVQAETYHERAEIVVSPTHSAPLGRIVTHEAWHIIDWRDNGHMDWGEELPPLYPQTDRTLG